MSKIPFSFTAMPKFFSKHGILDLRSPRSRSRLVFLYWAFSKCYTVFSLQEGIEYEAYSFSCSVEQCAKECGFTIAEAKVQFQFFVDHGFLVKVPNQIKNRISMFRWEISKLIDEKVIALEEGIRQDKEKTTNQKDEEDNLYKSQKQPTDYREENTEKQPTDLPIEKRVEKLKNNQPNQKTTDQTTNQTADKIRVENQKNTNQNNQPNPPFYRSDRAIEPSLYNSDNVAKPRARENLSPSCKGKVIAPFNRSTYRLRNGQPLSPRMQNALAKYSPTEMERVRENVRFYEEFIDNGGVVTTTHEQYLQGCIDKDLAKKKEYREKNLLLARFTKEEYKMNEMEIAKTSITIRKNSYETPDPISLEISPQSFSDALDNYINAYYSGNSNETRAK